MERGFLAEPAVTGQGNNSFKLKEGRLRFGIKKKSFTMRVVSHREAVGAPSLDMFRVR